MSKLIEEWRDIKDYEGLYQVSDWGRVKNRRGRFIAIPLSKYGYCRVHLWKNGFGKWFSVHRLVAEAFLPNLENKPFVGHTKTLENGLEDKTANEAWNIRWMTPSENRMFGTCNERIRDAQKGRKFSEKHKKNISESLKNSEIFQQVIHSNEYRQKLKDAQKDKPQLNREDLSQPIDQIDMETGEVLHTYPSAKQAARDLNVGQCNISRAANGGFFYKGQWYKMSYAYGFIWKKHHKVQKVPQLS